MSLDILKTLFQDDLFGSFGNTYGRYFAQLKEDDVSAKLKNIKIFNIEHDSLLIKIDKTKPPNTLFKNTKGERKRCDYLLITKRNSKYYLVFIEIKSAKLNNNHIIKQFKGAECIVDYSSAILRRFHDKPNFFNTFDKRFVCFYKPNIPKRTTRPIKNSSKPNSGKNTTPEKMLIYSDPICLSISELI